MFGASVFLAGNVNTVATHGPNGAGTVLDMMSLYNAIKQTEPGYGRMVILGIFPQLNTANQAGQYQSSEDNVTFTNRQSYDVAAVAGARFFNVPIYRYGRINNTAGTTSATNFTLFV